jgi:hypothetical protein
MTVLYRKIQNEADSKLLQEDMNNLLRWESDWQMEFHPSKCQILRVTNKRKPSPTSYDIHGHKLEIVDSAKYLEVTIHKTINWNTHIENITNSTRAFIQRNLQHCPQRTKAVCYTTLVRPLLEYACIVWGPFININIQKLESVQRRSAQFVMNDYRQNSSVPSMLNTLQWQPLAEKMTRCKAVMMYRIVNGLIAIPPLELHTTSSVARDHISRFLLPYARTSTYGHSFFLDSIRLWNSLPQPLMDSTSLDAFKQEVLSSSIP